MNETLFSLFEKGKYTTAVGLAMSEVEYARLELERATNDDCGARITVLHAEDALDLATNALIADGRIAGKNQAERDANLSLQVRHENAALMQARVAANIARAAYENARVALRVAQTAAAMLNTLLNTGAHDVNEDDRDNISLSLTAVWDDQ